MNIKFFNYQMREHSTSRASLTFSMVPEMSSLMVSNDSFVRRAVQQHLYSNCEQTSTVVVVASIVT
jgi:hypothetical protein